MAASTTRLSPYSANGIEGKEEMSLNAHRPLLRRKCISCTRIYGMYIYPKTRDKPLMQPIAAAMHIARILYAGRLRMCSAARKRYRNNLRSS